MESFHVDLLDSNQFFKKVDHLATLLAKRVTFTMSIQYQIVHFYKLNEIESFHVDLLDSNQFWKRIDHLATLQAFKFEFSRQKYILKSRFLYTWVICVICNTLLLLPVCALESSITFLIRMNDALNHATFSYFST